MVEIMAIAAMFLLRVGLPVAGLVLLGILIDKWQTKRDTQIKQQYQSDITVDFKKSKKDAAKDDDQQGRKAA
jgi:hypothetical protein